MWAMRSPGRARASDGAMEAVFDANIVVSALIFRGRLDWLRAAWTAGVATPVVCREIAAELLRVLSYPKFRLDAADRRSLLEDYLPYCRVAVLKDAVLLGVRCRDPKDDVYVALAVAESVALVTGDADLVALRGRVPVEILSAAEFAALVRR